MFRHRPTPTDNGHSLRSLEQLSAQDLMVLIARHIDFSNRRIRAGHSVSYLHNRHEVQVCRIRYDRATERFSVELQADGSTETVWQTLNVEPNEWLKKAGLRMMDRVPEPVRAKTHA